MLKRRKGIQSILGLLAGILFSQLLKSRLNDVGPSINGQCQGPWTRSQDTNPNPLDLLGMGPNETVANSERSLVLVGVMTAERYLETRARAVYETWGSQLPGRIAFFSSEHSSTGSDLPLVALPGVDDSYPPQRKSFEMLKYMHRHFGDRFEWFVRADDDVYVRPDRLEALLRSVDSRKPWFIGQAGRGNSLEIGQLALDHDENFCMGGPGVILSRETLRRVAPHIHKCLDNLVTSHEDVELGRCVRRFAGIQCTWSYEMQTILYHNQSGGAAFTGDLKQKEVHTAITMHPVKQPSHLYRLHAYVKGLNIQSLEQDKVRTLRDLTASLQELGLSSPDPKHSEIAKDVPLFPKDLLHSGDARTLGEASGLNRWRTGTDPLTLSPEDAPDWELLTGRAAYDGGELNPRRRLGGGTREGLNDVVREVMGDINMYSRQRGRVIEYRELTYGYWRLDPLHGVDLVLDMLLTYRKYRGHKMTVPVRRHAYMQLTFTGTHIRELHLEASRKSEKTPGNILFQRIHSVLSNQLDPLFNQGLKINRNDEEIQLILPLSGRHSTFIRFIRIYERLCVQESQKASLVVVLYRSDHQPLDYERTIHLITDFNKQYPSHKITILQPQGPFSRAAALQYGADIFEDQLLFFIDVDIAFKADTLLRVRYNTIKNQQIYFPIVYSRYDPRLLNENDRLPSMETEEDFHFDEVGGFWRQFGFGIASLYKEDLMKLGGFDTNITGWGFEDVNLYEKAIASGIRCMRTPDPGLVHIFHQVDCDPKLADQQKDMCLGTKASTLGALASLERYVVAHPEILQAIKQS